MELPILVIGNMDSLMDLENLTTLNEVHIKEIGRIIKDQEMGNTRVAPEQTILECGRMIKCMDLALKLGLMVLNLVASMSGQQKKGGVAINGLITQSMMECGSIIK